MYNLVKRPVGAARAALMFLLLAGLAWGTFGCGVKGKPRAPESPIIKGL